LSLRCSKALSTLHTPHCRRKVRLSHKSKTVAEKCDSLTFLRQCGQALSHLDIASNSGWKATG